MGDYIRYDVETHEYWGFRSCLCQKADWLRVRWFTKFKHHMFLGANYLKHHCMIWDVQIRLCSKTLCWYVQKIDYILLRLYSAQMHCVHIRITELHSAQRHCVHMRSSDYTLLRGTVFIWEVQITLCPEVLIGNKHFKIKDDLYIVLLKWVSLNYDANVFTLTVFLSTCGRAGNSLSESSTFDPFNLDSGTWWPTVFVPPGMHLCLPLN